MKRNLLLILVGLVIGGGLVWATRRGADDKPASADAKPEEPGPTLTHDADDRVVIHLSAPMRERIGVAVARPSEQRLARELKGYGRAADPGTVATLMTELASAEAAYSFSSNELARLTTLQSQGNASPRAAQTAEATARRDQLTVQSARDRLALSWSPSVMNQSDLPAFVQSLTDLKTILVRIDLPLPEVPESLPVGARVVALSGKSTEAEFLGTASGVDPQLQSQGFIFLIRPNPLHFVAGEAMTAYLKFQGDPIAGVVVPREAVVRTEGRGWVYVLSKNGETLTRTEIALDHPVETGWFVTQGVGADSDVVVKGAQTLLSEELKAAISPD